MLLPKHELSERQLANLLIGTGVVVPCAGGRRGQLPLPAADFILFGPLLLWALGYLYVALTC